MTPESGLHKCRDAFAAFRVDICTRIDQHLRHICMALESGKHKCRDAFAAFRVDICTRIDQHLRHICMALESGKHKSRETFAILRVDICTRINQQLRRIHITHANSMHKRRVAFLVFRGGIRAQNNPAHENCGDDNSTPLPAGCCSRIYLGPSFRPICIALRMHTDRLPLEINSLPRLSPTAL